MWADYWIILKSTLGGVHFQEGYEKLEEFLLIEADKIL